MYRIIKHRDEWYATEFDDLEEEVENYRCHLTEIEDGIVILCNDIKYIENEFNLYGRIELLEDEL